VVSNVVPASIASASSSSGTLTPTQGARLASTKITIHGHAPGSTNNPSNKNAKEIVLIELHPQTHSMASEWLDGLLMLLNQQPITSETSKLVNMVTDYGLKIRLLNVRYTDDYHKSPPELPSRDGVDEDYYYSLFV
jgi:engulfment/cell motility protein 1